MDRLELHTVVACVAAVCAAYRDGGELVQQIKARQLAKRALYSSQETGTSVHAGEPADAQNDGENYNLNDASTRDLEMSLSRGEAVIRTQFDRDFKRFGDTFAIGDRIARDALKDIIIHLQGQVIANLKVQWQRDMHVDVNTLQVSDITQDQAVMVLLELQLRIVTAAPEKMRRPAPLFAEPDSLGIRQLAHALPHLNTPPRSTSPVSISSFPIPPLPFFQAPLSPPMSDRPSTAQSQSPLVETASEKARHLGRTSIFRRSSKANQVSKQVGSSPVAPNLTAPYSCDHYNGAGSTAESKNKPADMVHDPLDLTRFGSVSTASSGVLGNEPNSPQFHPWKFPKPTGTSPSINQSVSSNSYYSRATSGSLPRISATASIAPGSVNVKDLLPAEANKFAGFCKGAWRLQIGDYKKAIMERQRPGGLYSAVSYWQCTKCRYEGRLVPHKKQAGFDTRVMIAEGVQFRWVFLFKSHVRSRDGMQDPMQASYGCVFCCAEGRGTPTFGGVRSFMTHLQEHRDRLPRGEVLYRMNCLVGRRASPDEDFDINLIGRTVEEGEEEV